MQSAIWKIVSAIGIVGIGTLVVLEVQHRLPPMPNSAMAPAVPADQQAVLGEQTLTPDSETEFDRLISGTAEEGAPFGFSEPAVPEPANVPPVSAAPLTVAATDTPVDTTVNRQQLADGGNPFQADSGFTADSAAPAADPAAGAALAVTPAGGTAQNSGTVQPASFEQNAFFSESASASSQAAPAAASSANTARGQALAAGSSATGRSAGQTAARSADPGTPNLMFFGEAQQPAGTRPAATGAQPAPRTAAPAAVAGIPASAAVPTAVTAAAASNRAQDGNFFGDDGDTPSLQLPGADTPGGSTAPAAPAFPSLDLPNEPAGAGNQPAAPATDDPFNGIPFEPDAVRTPSAPPTGAAGQPAAAPADDSLPFFGDDLPAAQPPGVPGNTNGGAGNGGAGNGIPGGNGIENPADDPGAPFFEMDEPGVPATPARPQNNTRPGTRPADGLGDNNEFPAMDLPFPEDDGGAAPGGRPGNRPGSTEPPADFPPLPDSPRESGSGNGPDPGRPSDNRPSEPDPFTPDLPANGNMPEFPADPRPDRPSRPSPSPSGDDPLSNEFPPLTPEPPADSGNPANSGDIPAADPRTTSNTLRPHISIRKDAPETASVGIPLDYTIVVQNEGQSPAYDVIVEDQLGRGISLVTTKPTADFDRTTGKMTWEIAELQPAERQEIVVRVTPTSEGTMDGVATVRFKAQVKATTVITAPRLSLQLTGPAEVRLGDEVRFRYVVRNDGSGEARDVILRSVLPEALKHSEGRDLEYEIESLAPNEEREIALTVIAAEPGSFSNTAEITSAGIETARAQTELNIVGAQLTVERLGPERRYVGKAAQFQNIISNDSNFEANNAVVQEHVPEGMKFVSAPSGDYNPQTRLITWKIDRIAPGKQVLLDVELMPESAGQMDAIVEVVENAGFRSRATKAVAVEDLHNVSADISRMDGPVAIGEKFTFTITLDNRGTASANEVQLTVQVPAQIKILAAGSKEQGIAARLGQGNMVVYNPVVRVEPNEIKTFQLVLQGQEPIRNGVVKAQLKYAEMQEPLVVSESVTVYSDSL